MSNKFPNKMIVNINLFGARFGDWVGSNEHGTIVVTQASQRKGEGDMELRLKCP